MKLIKTHAPGGQQNEQKTKVAAAVAVNTADPENPPNPEEVAAKNAALTSMLDGMRPLDAKPDADDSSSSESEKKKGKGESASKKKKKDKKTGRKKTEKKESEKTAEELQKEKEQEEEKKAKEEKQKKASAQA